MNDKELMVTFAFRYCLGRSTYAPKTFCDYVINEIGLTNLSEFCLKSMIKEIVKASEMQRIGDLTDANVWYNFMDKLNEHLNEGKNESDIN